MQQDQKVEATNREPKSKKGSFRSRRNQRKGKDKNSEATDKNNGAVGTNNLESLTRKFISAIFFQKFFRKSHTARQHKENHTMYRSPPRILLYGASNGDEHFERIEWAIKIAEGKYGLDGLRTLGFEYKLLACSQHQHLPESEKSDTRHKLLDSQIDGSIGVGLSSFPLHEQCIEEKKPDDNHESLECGTFTKSNVSYSEKVVPISDINHNQKQDVQEIADTCSDCNYRLYHIDSHTLITLKNRATFIADGEMYEVVVRLCQDYAQDLIQNEASLHWVSICDDSQKGLPVRALVHKDYKDRLSAQELEVPPESKDCHQSAVLPNTLLITTGRGKVRAGIFSRQHLLVSGVEASTCLGSVREAHKRGMRVIILDPNARGERNGMSTYAQSLQVIFRDKINQDAMPESTFIQQRDQNSSLYVLAHSASGSHLARHLIHDGSYIMQHLRAVAFTDSNHSVQWLDKHVEVSSFVQSPSCLYVRTANEYDWEKRVPGELCKPDQFWKHRFGNIHTIWAGTNDHSLSNWTAHSFIWEHFDKQLGCNETDVKINAA